MRSYPSKARARAACGPQSIELPTRGFFRNLKSGTRFAATSKNPERRTPRAKSTTAFSPGLTRRRSLLPPLKLRIIRINPPRGAQLRSASRVTGPAWTTESTSAAAVYVATITRALQNITRSTSRSIGAHLRVAKVSSCIASAVSGLSNVKGLSVAGKEQNE